jgi:hypothetical protein
MKKQLIFLTLSLYLLVSVANAQKIEILETGQFHGDEVTAETGENWLGLYKKGKTYSLLPTVLTVSKVHDAIADNSPNETTGKEVKTLGPGEPIFLIKGKGFEQSREIPTMMSGNTSIYNNWAGQFSFTDNKDKYSLKVITEKKLKGSGENLDFTSKLVLTYKDTTQIIYKQNRCDDCSWQLLWAGDLDSDGKLDLYLNLSDHYNVMNKRLFLSTQAESGEMVKEVAEFKTVGC